MVGLAESGIDLTKEWPPLSVKKVARAFEVTNRTVERWFDRGLDAIEMGGKLFTTRAALQRYGRLRPNEFNSAAVESLQSTAERTRGKAVADALDAMGVK